MIKKIRIIEIEYDDIPVPYDNAPAWPYIDPYNPYHPFDPWTPTWTPFIANKSFCQKCGLEISGVMGYVCPSLDCPTGLGGRSWTTNSPSIY